MGPLLVRVTTLGGRHVTTYGVGDRWGSIAKVDGVEVMRASHRTLDEAEAWTRGVLGIGEVEGCASCGGVGRLDYGDGQHPDAGRKCLSCDGTGQEDARTQDGAA
jgi:hypothetical protein